MNDLTINNIIELLLQVQDNTNITASFDGTIYTISRPQWDSNTGLPTTPITQTFLATDFQSVLSLFTNFQQSTPKT